MVNKNNDNVFESFFKKTVGQIPTKEEVEKIRADEEKRRQEVARKKSLALEYVSKLPGAENASDDNPIVEIRGEVASDGHYYERAVTRNECIDESFSKLFSTIEQGADHEQGNKYRK